jgi:hypothetical protein
VAAAARAQAQAARARAAQAKAVVVDRAPLASRAAVVAPAYRVEQADRAYPAYRAQAEAALVCQVDRACLVSPTQAQAACAACRASLAYRAEVARAVLDSRAPEPVAAAEQAAREARRLNPSRAFTRVKARGGSHWAFCLRTLAAHPLSATTTRNTPTARRGAHGIQLTPARSTMARAGSSAA